ncbi:hypothetical protein ACR6L2_002776 [Enterococcus hirae]|nr:hypothetical protein [Enterococcus hirae]
MYKAIHPLPLLSKCLAKLAAVIPLLIPIYPTANEAADPETPNIAANAAVILLIAIPATTEKAFLPTAK